MHDFFQKISEARSSLLSMTGAVTGTAIAEIEPISNIALNTFFQHAAWTVGIIAGLFSITKSIYDFRKSMKDENKA